MTEPLKRTAVIYDFDGTLARGNIQENSFIPEIGMSKENFWGEVKAQAKQHDADEILIYMQLMLARAKERSIDITRDKLRDHGSTARLFEGLADRSWFVRLNTHAADRGLQLEHYIISSGTYEMLCGCAIFDEFKRVFASAYVYEDGKAIWPGVAINYTTKTQYLFRINKGIDNIWDNDRINAYMPEDERPIPFSRMIFVGDGDTDIPTMKMMTYKGGSSVAVYDPDRDARTLSKIHKLISDGRVDFVAPADYVEHSQMDIIVKGIIGRIARAEGYRPGGAGA